MEQIVAAIEKAAPEAKGKITFRNEPLPFPRHNDTGELAKVIGPVCQTRLEDGIRISAELFRAAVVR